MYNIVNGLGEIKWVEEEIQKQIQTHCKNYYSSNYISISEVENMFKTSFKTLVFLSILCYT